MRCGGFAQIACGVCVWQHILTSGTIAICYHCIVLEQVARCCGASPSLRPFIHFARQSRTLEMWVSVSVTGLAGGRSQKWTLSGADPAGCARRRFRYMCSVKNGVKGDMTCAHMTQGLVAGSAFRCMCTRLSQPGTSHARRANTMGITGHMRTAPASSERLQRGKR